MKKFPCAIVYFIFSFTFYFPGNAQTANKFVRCGTTQWLNQVFYKYPEMRLQYELNEEKLGQAINERRTNPNARTAAIIDIPVVFHIVTNNQATVTDEMIKAQLDTLNKDWGGMNADSSKIPAAFKPLFGKSNLRFCLARRTPGNTPSNGINRVTTNTTSNGEIGDPVKYTSKGGADAWDQLRFVNFWIVRFSDGNNLGYATYPIGTPENPLPGGSPAGDQGVVVATGTLPGGNFAPYNKGRTLTHELGHYFWLRHINGDVGCGDDFPSTPSIDDTPLQRDLTAGCPTGVVNSGCAGAPNPPGKMYQNFMDYTEDACMAMFSKGQNIRAEQALDTYRPTLRTSNGCTPVNLPARDISPAAFIEPFPYLCEPTSSRPIIQITSFGRDTVRSLTIHYAVNNGPLSTLTLPANLVYAQSANFILNTVNFSTGNNFIRLYTSQPNGQADLVPSNDTLAFNVRVLTPQNAPLVEGFESTLFPPVEWDILQQPVDALTWQRTTRAGKNSSASAYMDNFKYAAHNRIDNLITPLLNYSGADSVFFKFDVAAATYSFPGSTAVQLDTLEVLATLDCGRSFTSIYKKWGHELQTIGNPNSQNLTEFYPNNAQWRTDSINVTGLLGSSNKVRFAFRNITHFENNIFIDNVNFRIKVLPARLKQEGLLINPSPFTHSFAIQSFSVTDLKAYAVYNSVGQLVNTKSYSGRAENFIEVNMQNQPAGVYTVKVFYSNRTVSRKVIKVN